MVNQSEKLTGSKIISPVSGKLHPLHDSYPFNENIRMYGEGVVVDVESHSVVSPINGTVISVDRNIGRVIIQAPNKMRILMQILINKPEHFPTGIKLLVNDGSKVEKSQDIMALDLYSLKQQFGQCKLHFVFLDHNFIEQIVIRNKHVEQTYDDFVTLLLKERSSK